MGSFIEYVNRSAQKLVGPTRRNHGLEHATVSILLRRFEHPIHVIGRSTSDGFYIQADVSSDEVESAAREALERMQKGEGHLAVSPFCGTNLVIAGALAALASYVVLGRQNRASRLPTAMAAATMAVLVAQPLGVLAQRHVTTSPDVKDVRIVGVKRVGSPERMVYKVETAPAGAYDAGSSAGSSETAASAPRTRRATRA